MRPLTNLIFPSLYFLISCVDSLGDEGKVQLLDETSANKSNNVVDHQMAIVVTLWR